MKVKLYAVNQDTGAESFERECDVADLFEDSDECWNVTREVKEHGRCWIGGGAAQLFYAVKA